MFCFVFYPVQICSAHRSVQSIVYSKCLLPQPRYHPTGNPTHSPYALHKHHTQSSHTRDSVYRGKIVLIYPVRNINHIISNNCQRQFASQARDFILIDFFTCSRLTLIRFPLTECLLKALHPEIYKSLLLVSWARAWLDMKTLNRVPCFCDAV